MPSSLRRLSDSTRLDSLDSTRLTRPSEIKKKLAMVKRGRSHLIKAYLPVGTGTTELWLLDDPLQLNEPTRVQSYNLAPQHTDQELSPGEARRRYSNECSPHCMPCSRRNPQGCFHPDCANSPRNPADRLRPLSCLHILRVVNHSREEFFSSFHLYRQPCLSSHCGKCRVQLAVAVSAPRTWRPDLRRP